MRKHFLSNSILKLYSSTKLYNKVKDVYNLFDYLESAIPDFEYPIVSSLGRVRYEQFVPNVNNSKLEEFVLGKLIFELRGNDYKRKIFSSKVAIALRRLSKIELIVFRYSIYDKYEIDYIAELVNYGNTKVKEIKKSACIKFLMALNIDQDCLKGGDEKIVNKYFDSKVATAQM